MHSLFCDSTSPTMKSSSRAASIRISLANADADAVFRWPPLLEATGI